ncbi:MAG: NAD(+) synthase [Proteobacteria bacterium]|nr:MAG: NAD(+) synthase [Pseudomonadota bacterium]
MLKIRVAGAALNQTPLDWKGNLARILEAIGLARAKEVALLCLPEMCITGYGCEDAFLAKHLQRSAFEGLEKIIAESGGIAVSAGLPIAFEGKLYNSSALVADGKLYGFRCKQVLAGEGIYYEPRWFSPWPQGQSGDVEFDGRKIPIGDLIFEFKDFSLGFEICEDAWAKDRVGQSLAKQGAGIILNPSASHFAFGKFEVRKNLAKEASRKWGVAYIYANLLGNDSGRAIYDGGTIIATKGEIAALGPRLSFGEVVLTESIVEIPHSNTDAQDKSCRTSRRVRVAYQPQATRPNPKPNVAAAGWESSANLKEEEFARAVSLGLHDYARKSRSHGFVVSISGGVDSASVACLVAVMLNLACKEIGLRALKERFSYMPEIAKIQSEKQLIAAMLTCVYQSTENNSATTSEAARLITEALGATYFTWEIDDLVAKYINTVEKRIGRSLTWEQDDIALQNIQARARGPAVWLIANLKSALLLATSNRSESAVGYTTMDGDTCGGLSPIAGVDKAFLRKWLLWLEKSGPQGLGPISALNSVNQQEPTAELRPLALNQTDEGDLMPYEVLDIVERLAIRDRLAPKEIFEKVRTELSSHDPRNLKAWIKRFFELWCRNQWKRERYAPSFHLDDESLDPKTWCRFPILSGGFKKELEELDRIKT